MKPTPKPKLNLNWGWTGTDQSPAFVDATLRFGATFRAEVNVYGKTAGGCPKAHLFMAYGTKVAPVTELAYANVTIDREELKRIFKRVAVGSQRIFEERGVRAMDQSALVISADTGEVEEHFVSHNLELWFALTDDLDSAKACIEEYLGALVEKLR